MLEGGQDRYHVKMYNSSVLALEVYVTAAILQSDRVSRE